jgi:excisionase family DNA binding protein
MDPLSLSEPQAPPSTTRPAAGEGARQLPRARSLTDLPPLLTVDEVADVLRTTRKAIYARAERGLLPGALRDGRRLLVERDELLHALSQGRSVAPGRRRR